MDGGSLAWCTTFGIVFGDWKAAQGQLNLRNPYTEYN